MKRFLGSDESLKTKNKYGKGISFVKIEDVWNIDNKRGAVYCSDDINLPLFKFTIVIL